MAHVRLDISDLSVTYTTRRGPVEAVSGVSLEVLDGEVFGVVGEYGAGKTTLLEAVLGILPPTAHATGQVLYDGMDLFKASPAQLRRLRTKHLALISSNALERLVPVVPVGDQLVNVYRSHESVSRPAARAHATDLIRSVGIADPRRVARAYPGELSGGMAQRVVIAMALLCDPDVVLADDPTHGLDVTIQVQIIELLTRLTQERSAAMLLVTRDATIVSHYCDRVLLLRAGAAVTSGTVREVLDQPGDPYTRAFFEAYAL